MKEIGRILFTAYSIRKIISRDYCVTEIGIKQMDNGELILPLYLLHILRDKHAVILKETIKRNIYVYANYMNTVSSGLLFSLSRF
jgi:hypothetical protein